VAEGIGAVASVAAARTAAGSAERVEEGTAGAMEAGQRAVVRAAATAAATAVATGAEEPPLRRDDAPLWAFRRAGPGASAVPMAIPVVPAASVVTTAARWRRVETASRRA